jgi:hypothetical protein
MNNVVKLDEQRPSASAMTKGEQSDLLKLIRARERLANTMAEERKAELVADLEKQLGRIFHYDQDETWRSAVETAQQVVAQAQTDIAKRCDELGIPKEFAPGVSFSWYGRGENGSKKRRDELRKMGLSKLDALARSARSEIAKRSVQAQQEVITHGLHSEAAKSFLESMGSVDALMPPIDAQGLLTHGGGA